MVNRILFLVIIMAWNVNRVISKINCITHTDAIKNTLTPLNLQNQFAVTVEKVETLKSRY